MVWVHGQEGEAAICEAPGLRARLLELADEGPVSDLDSFWGPT